ncbi:DUF4189 domain-containing protein [Trinickia caryophylli]|uniref:DUF4189 domain-containing protein n=1 Tax=Trinickia caryophylli TaxID=28094 RepID=A0A1X7F3L9_TRICW|nr:DUF4189 domain-containing protein [Trinickia caryophylli]PMS10385.1 DUF4189 domain-containing protein [Trinickia caryophylli]TRX19492.1 DUF4189 domain-containing protein [Trinickia caryophylli]WQE13199.1 DUF4189 domain-containing protein [Trinickia caryophylli]SMF44718.1 protein of unknown function [Trinickia caryophylli]GLU34493.1 hypothetical protein Busp01_43350 [Trinickia caryophylli]
MKWLAFLGTMIFAQAAFAQCAPGIPSAGNSGCIPPDRSNSPYYQGGQQTAPPPAVWADRWGAVVVDGKTGQAGLVTGRASRQDAIDAATHDCEKFGSAHCKLQLAYHNQCVAIGWGQDRFNTSSAPSLQEAESDAMNGCNRIATGCKIAYSACSFAERVR